MGSVVRFVEYFIERREKKKHSSQYSRTICRFTDDRNCHATGNGASSSSRIHCTCCLLFVPRILSRQRSRLRSRWWLGSTCSSRKSKRRIYQCCKRCYY